MHILVVRHGIAHDRMDPHCPPDPERALTDEGTKKTTEAARGLAALGYRAARLYSSPYVRARQTAAIFRAALAPTASIAETEALHWDAPPERVAALLAEVDDDTALFGHAPNLDLVCAHLCGAPTSAFALKKAAVAVLAFAGGVRAGGAEIVAVLPPKVLRAVRS